MAITGIEYAVLQQAKDQGLFAAEPDILELGEAEWYGDVPIDRFQADITRRVGDEGRRQDLLERVRLLVEQQPEHHLFAMGRLFYEAVLTPRSLTTIDLHGTPQALPLNLNEPIDLGRQFDLILNLGTLEHVFNVYQGFKTLHEHIRPHGVMVHGLPFTGWIDHGFYNFQPTFYFDLAKANGYKVLGAVYAELSPLRILPVTDRDAVAKLARSGQLGPNSLLYVILKAPAELAPFAVPMQGYYAGQLSPEAHQTWHDLR